VETLPRIEATVVEENRDDEFDVGDVSLMDTRASAERDALALAGWTNVEMFASRKHCRYRV
jgi:hypothetical protein